MPHFPSMFVGCLASGAMFLLVHEQLSYRRRLSHKWEIRESAEQTMRDIAAQIRLARGQDSTKKIQGGTSIWNDTISSIQKGLERDDKE